MDTGIGVYEGWGHDGLPFLENVGRYLTELGILGYMGGAVPVYPPAPL